MAQKRKTAKRKPQAKAMNAAAKKTVSQAKRFQSNTVRQFSNFNPGNLTDIQSMEKLMSKSKNQFEQLTSEGANIGREGFEAMMKSSSIFAKRLEEIVRTSMALAQSAAEKQTEVLKQVMAAKSPNEFAEIQNKAAQQSYDELMANATKLSEMSVRAMTECAEPINNQINKAVQKASQAMAA